MEMQETQKNKIILKMKTKVGGKNTSQMEFIEML
jgi:hypothetical protein